MKFNEKIQWLDTFIMFLNSKLTAQLIERKKRKNTNEF